MSQEKVGDAFVAQNDARGALDAYRASLAIVEQLAAKDPTNAVLQSDLFLGHAKVADMLQATGELDHALAEHRSAIAIAEAAAAKDPSNAERQTVAELSSMK